MISTVTSAGVLSYSDTKSTGRGPYVLGCTMYTTKIYKSEKPASPLEVYLYNEKKSQS